jgi:hypothetical protein
LRFGVPWPEPRFEARADTVFDRLTGAQWRRAADLAGPVIWNEALARVADLNRDAGRQRWRLPNINELESLVNAASSVPALPHGHPFTRVHDVYWSASTSLYQPDWAWALYLDKGAIGVGQKQQARFHVWVMGEESAR